MILTGSEIIKQVELGNIFIDPFELKNINPNSYNYSLGDSCIDLSNNKSVMLPPDGIQLKAKQLYLFSTYESIGSDMFVTSLIGRSSIGRLGIFLTIDADLGHIGTKHKWTLEIMAIQPVILYPRMKIGQVSFWIPNGKVSLYKGKYIEFDEPKRSIHKPNKFQK